MVENKKLADREKILEMPVKKVESDNKSLLKKIESDQTEIDILKVKVAELEEEKAHRDEQNKYLELKNKELEAAKKIKEHELYMMNKVLENMLGKSIEQRFKEIEVEELRAKRQAEIDAQMQDKGTNVEGSVIAERSIVLSTDPKSPIQNPTPISSISAIFDEDVLLEDMGVDDVDNDEDDDEEDDEEENDDKKDDDEKVFSASSYSSDDNDDDDDQGGAEEGEIRYTYTLDEVLKMFNVNEDEFKFDFEDELTAFDINHQPEYEYKYVEDADVYESVEIQDSTDEESVGSVLTFRTTQSVLVRVGNVAEIHFRHDTKKTVIEWSRNRGIIL
ncbi:hypothetical protein Hanom_Chr09g00772671 [Helianthus anomalus]